MKKVFLSVIASFFIGILFSIVTLPVDLKARQVSSDSTIVSIVGQKEVASDGTLFCHCNMPKADCYCVFGGPVPNNNKPAV